PWKNIHAQLRDFALQAFIERRERDICLARPVKRWLQIREVFAESLAHVIWVRAVVERLFSLYAVSEPRSDLPELVAVPRGDGYGSHRTGARPAGAKRGTA